MTTVAAGQDYAPAYDGPGELRAALLDEGLLIDTGVDGLYHRSGTFEDVLQGVERYAAAQRVDTTAARRWFPPIMGREAFLRTDYVRSFPDLLGSVDVFTGNDRDHRALLVELDEGRDWTERLQPAEVVLTSAACHSLYSTLPADIPADGLSLECCGFVFRHEPSLDPARMQSFRMYEHVRVGTPDQALTHRDEWLARGRASLEALGLPVRVEAANDPFFGRLGQMLEANQLGAQLKYELVLDITAARGTAIASANYHEDHFGSTFALTTPDGGVAHSACFAYGLERITLGLFAVHGLRPDAWPPGLRAALSC